MIECTYPVLAVYQSDAEKAETTLLVIAWDDKGEALVLGEKALVAASSTPGFVGLRLAGSPPEHKPVDPVIVRPKPRENRDQP